MIVAIVSHYEKKISELQDTCGTLANQMAALMVLLTTTKHQQENVMPEGVLQPNQTFLQSLNQVRNTFMPPK